MTGSQLDRPIERIDRILCGRQIYPCDWFNHPIFMDPRPRAGTEYHSRLMATAKMAVLAADATSFGLDPAFRAGGMSNGALARDFVNRCKGDTRQGILSYAVRRFGRPLKTTQNLRYTASGTEMMNNVILPNREADYHAANFVESRFPDKSIVYPIGFENAVRTQKADNALSQGASFQDWTFEYYWGLRVLRSNSAILDGTNRYDSRYLGIEDNISDFIQAGFLDDYRDDRVPGREFDITDAYGRQVPLADRAWGRAKHVFDWTEDEFATDLAAGVLLGQFMLDDWLRGEGKPVGFAPLDRKKLHPVLTKRTPEELARMDRLKEMMLPYIAEKCLDLIPYEEDPNLKKYVEEKVLPAKEKFKALDLAEIKQTLFTEQILGDVNLADQGPRISPPEGFKAEFESVAKPVKRRDTDGRYFTTPAKLFDDNHFGKLSRREHAGLPNIIGGIEGRGRNPENAPNTLYYIAEPKGGSRAKAYMEKHGINHLPDAYGAENQVEGKGGFFKKVIKKNLENIAREVAALAGIKSLKEQGFRNIISTADIKMLARGAEHWSEFVAASGPEKLSPRAVLALQMEVINRNSVHAVALRKDWHVHHDEATLAVHALQIALGQVKRPYNGGDYKMKIFEFDPETGALKKLDLADMIMTLGRDVDKKLSCSPPPEAREHYLAMARMLQVLDMYMDPGRMNYREVQDPETGGFEKREIIHFRNIEDPHLLHFWYNDPQKRAELVAFRDHMREKLLNVGVLYFEEDDLKGLHEEYTAKWNEARGEDADLRRMRYAGRQTFQEWSGPT